VNERLFFAVCGVVLVCGVSVPASVSGAQLTPADWLRADAATVRLAPSVFVNLPLSIRRAMERRGCTVPQPVGSARPRNVISGHLTHATRTDWAALCSREKRSSILVFHGQDFSDVDELADAPDSEYLQTVSGGGIGFSRALSVATPTIVRRARAAPALQTVDHDGIADAFEGKGSMIWYWPGGKWISFLGSD
jgi:hypothetical protein